MNFDDNLFTSIYQSTMYTVSIFVFALLLNVGLCYGAVGNLRDVDLNDKGVVEASLAAIKLINEDSTNNFGVLQLSKVVGAKRQVVAGMKYYLTLLAGTPQNSSCQPSADGPSSCVLQAGSFQLFNVQVWDQPWRTPRFVLTASESSAASADLLGDMNDNVLSSCQRKAKEASDKCPAGMVGCLIPQCKSDGSYEPRQCHASTGFCWCANLLTGERIPSTSQRGLVDCSAYAYTGVANDSSADAAEAKRDLGNGDVSIDTGEKHEAEKETVDDDAEDAASLPHIKDESETASRAAVDGSSKDVDVDSAEADAAAGERVADAVPAGSSYSFMIPILVIGALLACGLKKSKLGYSQISQ